MKGFKNWTEVTKGLYRYVVGANVSYEIHILYWNHETDILTAKASLYIVGDWLDENKQSFTERECLIKEVPVFECVLTAIKDMEE